VIEKKGAENVFGSFQELKKKARNLFQHKSRIRVQYKTLFPHRKIAFKVTVNLKN
jgi:hypothetical protein